MKLSHGLHVCSMYVDCVLGGMQPPLCVVWKQCVRYGLLITS